MFDWKIKKESDEELKQEYNHLYFMAAILGSLGVLFGLKFAIMAFFGKDTNFVVLFTIDIMIITLLLFIGAMLLSLGQNQYKIMLELRELKGGKSGKKK